jgi:hypothetical protein
MLYYLLLFRRRAHLHGKIDMLVRAYLTRVKPR